MYGSYRGSIRLALPVGQKAKFGVLASLSRDIRTIAILSIASNGSIV